MSKLVEATGTLFIQFHQLQEQNDSLKDDNEKLVLEIQNLNTIVTGLNKENNDLRGKISADTKDTVISTDSK